VRGEDIEERYIMACFKLKHMPTDIHKGFYLMGYELGLQAEREKSKQQFDLGYKHGVREGRGDFKSDLVKEKEAQGE